MELAKKHERDVERLKNRKLAVHFTGFIVFCSVCGQALSWMELPEEERMIREHKDNSDVLYRVMKDLVAAGQVNASVMELFRGTCDLDLSPYFEPNWRFPGAFSFVVTIVTTIGFGNYVPVTSGGKFVTCVIAIIGVACEFRLRGETCRASAH